MIHWIINELGTAPKNEVKENNYKIVDVRDMVDKQGNPKQLILEKINTAIQLIKEKNKVVICCDYGLSRSNAIAVGVLVKYYGYNFEEAVKLIIKKTNKEAIQLGMLESVRCALDLNESKQKNKKAILITGASGFIGSALTKTLKDKYDLIAPPGKEINLLNGSMALDLLVKEFKPNLIIHLANPRIYTPTQAMGEMIVMLKNVLDVCRINDIPIIYPSSWVVFGGYYDNKLLSASEKLTPRPKDTYGETKMLCEMLLRHYQEIYGLKVCLLRISPVYGSDSDKPKFIWNFLEKAKNNLPIYTHKYKNGPPILDLLHIKDLVRAIEAIIEKDFFGTLHLGSGKGFSTFEIAQKIKKICGSESKIFLREIDDYNANIIMDISKAQKVLNWAPNIDIDEGLMEIIKRG